MNTKIVCRRMAVISALCVIFYYGHMYYYTFITPKPDSVARYLSLKGVKEARIWGAWNLEFGFCERSLKINSCHQPSKIIGQFNCLRSIKGYCDEFDLADIRHNTNLYQLYVEKPGYLRSIECLRELDLFDLLGSVEAPITDDELLEKMQSRSWKITLRPSSSTFSAACSCPKPDLYFEFIITCSDYQQATEDDRRKLRGQAFPSINGIRTDKFWESIDQGIFNNDIFTQTRLDQ